MSFRELMSDRVTLVKPDGRRFENIPAVVSPTEIHTDDAKLPIEEGDRFERALPNGLLESYLVLDRGFHTGFSGIPDHYQVSVRKESAIPRRPAGPTVYNITGPNARVNINSTDLSANVVNISPDNLFAELRSAVSSGVHDAARREHLLELVESLAEAAGKKTFLATYRDFMAAAADHMTLLAPFIPALSQLLR